MAFTKSKQSKLPVEKLQEDHLTGPANESMEEVSAALKDNQVVVIKEKPDYESVIFRNQRDPGYPLEFHYASKSHPFKQYKLIDGQKYDLPREVIRNLESCRENIEKYRKGSQSGLPEI